MSRDKNTATEGYHPLLRGIRCSSGKSRVLPRWHSWERTRLPMKDTYEMKVRSLGREDPLEEGMAAHSSFLAWEIPWTEEPGGLRSMGYKESDTTEATEQKHA